MFWILDLTSRIEGLVDRETVFQLEPHRAQIPRPRFSASKWQVPSPERRTCQLQIQDFTVLWTHSGMCCGLQSATPEPIPMGTIQEYQWLHGDFFENI